jgi:uncharacterized protein YecT (DUF1311 family)
MVSTTAYCGAQQSSQWQECSDKAHTQMSLNVCASEEAKRADDELSETYQKLLSLVKGNKKADAAIRSSERAWLLYRDSYLKAMYPEENKQAAYGSMFSMEFDLNEADLAREHMRALNDLIQQYDVP